RRYISTCGASTGHSNRRRVSGFIQSHRPVACNTRRKTATETRKRTVTPSVFQNSSPLPLAAFADGTSTRVASKIGACQRPKGASAARVVLSPRAEDRPLLAAGESVRPRRPALNGLTLLIRPTCHQPLSPREGRLVQHGLLPAGQLHHILRPPLVRQLLQHQPLFVAGQQPLALLLFSFPRLGQFSRQAPLPGQQPLAPPPGQVP